MGLRQAAGKIADPAMLRADQLLDDFGDALIAVSPAGTIVIWNRGAEEMFGYTRDEILGRAWMETLVPPEHRAEEQERLIRAARDTGTATYEAVRKSKSGATLHVDVTTRRVYDEEGTTRYIAIGMKDVTSLVADRRKAEASFRALLEAAPDATVIVDGNGKIVLVNSQTERLFGYPRSELIGRPVEILVPDRFRARHLVHRGGYTAHPRARPMGASLELFAVRRDGIEFPVEISLSPLDTEEGILVSSAIRDVTERKRTENELKLAYAELEAFSYSVAHDLRAPLRGISGFAQILLDEHADDLDTEGQDCLREIRANVTRMGALIDALLSLSRVTQAELRPERVDLAALARDVLAKLVAADSDRAVEVLLPEHLWARADPALAHALLENLIGNAWKFTSKTPAARIEVGADEERGTREFFVRDNGSGFDMRHAARLFAPFQRLHSEREFSGTGIGLATAQRIVHRHGGRIRAVGEVGRGAIFHFSLPDEPAGGAS